jgi:hypothetical protein
LPDFSRVMIRKADLKCVVCALTFLRWNLGIFRGETRLEPAI